MPRKTNPFGRTRKADAPYAVYRSGQFTFKVLKTYKHPDNERKDAYARWFLATKSPHTYGTDELGDGYAHDILRTADLVECTDEWREHYEEVTPSRRDTSELPDLV